MARLTREQRQAMLKDYEDKVPTKEIGARYGVSDNYVTVLAARRGVERRKPLSAAGIRKQRISRIVRQIVDHVRRELEADA